MALYEEKEEQEEKENGQMRLLICLLAGWVVGG